MASIMKRGNTYSVRYNYKDHAGKPCKGWETFKTKAEAQERKINGCSGGTIQPLSGCSGRAAAMCCACGSRVQSG